MSSSFPWHTQEFDSVAHELNTDPEQGLSNKEATSRLATYGCNELRETHRSPWLKILLRQNISLIIPVLVLASVILVNAQELLSSAVFVIGILVAGIILSSLQEAKSEGILRSLRRLANRSMYARVLRSGHVSLVKATELVPGDIICLEEGDRIAADGRLIKAKQLTIDEFAITNTAEPVEKDVAALDKDAPLHPIYLRKNMVFMGSIVTSGSGRAIVTETGARTQASRTLAAWAAKAKSARWSLLEARLSKKGLWFGGGCIIVSALLWVAIITLLPDMLMLDGAIIALSFLVAAWPMGLIEAITMALTVSMKKLDEHQIAIRNFPGAEALASVTVICSDKKGIMTENQMTVKKVFVDGGIMDVEGDGYDPESGGFPPNAEEDNPDLPLLLTVASMCTDAEVKNTPEGWNLIGDPTEGALVIAAMKGGMNKDELGLSLTKIAEFPFDPERKRMSVVYRSAQDELFIFARGSLEMILDISDNIQLHGRVDNLDVARRRAIWAVNQSFARDSMQNMAFAYCQLRDEPEEYTVEEVESGLVFVGMMGIADPSRADTESAIRRCLANSIKPVMFADGSVDTAFAFAYKLGLAQDGDEILTGEELDILGDKEYSSLAERFSVYADILPAHKLRIVRTLKEKGEVTAIIGGHASNADSIKESDVGIVAGRTGSSATTEAADIVVMDDSFATVVDAIEVMRRAYGNARKLIRYFLSGSMAVAGTILVSLIISLLWKNFPYPPLLFPHVLWIGLFAVSIPALAIIFNPVAGDTTKDKPYPRGSVFDDKLRSEILIRGMLTTILALIVFAFSLGREMDQGRAMTATISLLVMAQLVFAFQCRRTPDEGFFRKFLTSKLLLVITLLVVLLHLCVVYIPVISELFGTESLRLVDWIPILIALVICSLPLDELFVSGVEEEEEEPEDIIIEAAAEEELVEEETPEDSDEETA